MNLLRREAEKAAGVESQDMPAKATEFTSEMAIGTDWKQYTLTVPYDGKPTEGYNLVVKSGATAAASVLWLDDVRFEPVWKP